MTPSPVNSRSKLTIPFDAKSLAEHVEGHLVIGPLSRCCRPISLFLVLMIATKIYDCYQAGLTSVLFFRLLDIAIYVVLLRGMLKHYSPRTEASMLWITMNMTLLFAGVLCATALSISTLESSPLTAVLVFLLGISWVPSLEFFPRLTPFQKWITAGRILLTLLISIIGYQWAGWFHDL